MAKITLPHGFGLWSQTLQDKWMRDNDPGFTPCECGCNRAQHANSRGMCNGYHCQCCRFVKLTPQTIHMRMMRDALSGAIDIIEALPVKGRNIKIGMPEREEWIRMLNQMKKAIAGPAVRP